MQAFYLTHHTYSTEDGINDDRLISIGIRCFGAWIEIEYRPQFLANSPDLLAQHNRSLDTLRADYGRDTIEREELIHSLKKPFEKLMKDVAPKQFSNNLLFDYLYIQYLVLEATAEDQTSRIIQPRFKGSLPRQLVCPPGYYLQGEGLQSVKSFTSRQIQLMPTSSDLNQHPCLYGPSKVIAGDGKICFFKQLVDRCLIEKVARDQPWIYKQIEAAFEAKKLHPDIRICRLHSVVIDEDRDVLQHYIRGSPKELAEWTEGMDYSLGNNTDDGKRIVGILLTYIENKGTLYDVVSLSSCTNEQRCCWSFEIERFVNELHAADLIWGDAKPHNVLVDRDDQLWLIDFDGSYTQGWVDKDKKETQEGDLQGLERIKAWLTGEAAALEANRYL